jgi:hypothetical protein
MRKTTSLMLLILVSLLGCQGNGEHISDKKLDEREMKTQQSSLLDTFEGKWILVANTDGSKLNESETPVLLKITKEDNEIGLFYLVEASFDNGKKYEPLLGKGRYERKGNFLLHLTQQASLEIKDNSNGDEYLYEENGSGYFKRIN